MAQESSKEARDGSPRVQRRPKTAQDKPKTRPRQARSGRPWGFKLLARNSTGRTWCSDGRKQARDRLKTGPRQARDGPTWPETGPRCSKTAPYPRSPFFKALCWLAQKGRQWVTSWLAQRGRQWVTRGRQWVTSWLVQRGSLKGFLRLFDVPYKAFQMACKAF